MSEENKALARRAIDEIWNKSNAGALERFIASHFVGHDPATSGTISGVDGYRQFFHRYTSAFPDQHFSIGDIVAEGDRMVTRWSVEATHTGDLAGIAPTGRRVRVTGIAIARIENGKIAEEHNNWDALGRMQQLGAIRLAARTGA